LVGGVCSGLAYYFGIQAIWVRLLFAISFAFAGSGILLYIILWAVIPKAATRADRMAMKGQKLNLQGFKQNLEEELSSVRNNFNEFSQDAKPFVYKTRDFIGEFFHHLGSFVSQSGKIFVKLIGIVILLACFGFLIALIVAFIGTLAFGHRGLYHLFPFNVMEHQVNTVILWAGFLLLAIPLLVLSMVGTGLVFENYGLRRGLGSTLLIIWMCTLSVIIYYAVKIGAEFRHSASFSQNVSIKPSSNGIYYLKLNDAKFLSAEDSVRLHIKERFKNSIILNDNDDEDENFESPSNVSLSIEKADVPAPILVESFSARGVDYEDALANAQNTNYRFGQQDSVILFSRRLEKPANKLWRNQEVHLTLKVPVNVTVVIERDLQSRIYLHNVNVWECNRDNETPDAKSAMYVMTAEGLQCKIDTAAVAKRRAAMQKDE
jgi:phage shock protein PspC (stress-responsive transcriptional regulator)